MESRVSRRVRAISHTPWGGRLRDLPIDYFSATLENADRIPRAGGALLVGNHAMYGLDGIVLGALVLRETDRPVRFLAERNLFRVPLLGDALRAVGTVPGEPGKATDMLRAGELVGVYPGGIDDSWKLRSERYRLMWGERAGFARVAARAGVPIVPIAAFGIDEMYDVVAREHVVGRTIMGSARYDLPLALGRFGTPIPKPNPQRYVVLSPIAPAGDPDDPAAVTRLREATHAALDGALAAAR